MKLSEQERQFIIQHPRNFFSELNCFKSVTRKLDPYELKMRNVIQFLIQLYVYNCTLPFDKAVQKAHKKFLVSKEEIIVHLQKINHAMAINKAEEKDSGNYTVLLRYLAFLASTHHQHIETFLGTILKLEGSEFLVISDTIYLLSICPELPKDSLVRILVYRTGFSFEKIVQILNMPIPYLCPKVQKYVIMHFELEENSFFELCHKKGCLIHFQENYAQFY